MAIEPIFGAGQLAGNIFTAQQLPRGQADAAPPQQVQLAQAQTLRRELETAAERAPTTLSDVGSTPTYDVHARVEPVPADGRGRGRLFDARA